MSAACAGSANWPEANRDRKLRVAFVIASSDIGGGEQVILSLLRDLPDHLFERYVICPASGPMVEQYARWATRIFTVRGRSFLSPRVILRIARILRDLHVDLVQTSLYTSDVAGIVGARLAGARRVVSYIVGRNFFVTEEQGLRAARMRLCALVYRGIYRGADRLIAVCESVRKDLIERPGLRVAPAKVCAIRYGLSPIDMEASSRCLDEMRMRCGLSAQDAVLVTVANLIPLKGHQYLLEAMGRIARVVPRLRWVLIGDGSHRQALEALTDRLKVRDHVVFAGLLDEVRKHALLRLCRAVALPSLNEGLPVSLLEAMAFGKPVVATDVGGIREILEPGVTGLLVPPRDPEALAQAIIDVLTDDALGDRLGRSGQRRLAEAFPPSEVQTMRFAEQYLNLCAT